MHQDSTILHISCASAIPPSYTSFCQARIHYRAERGLVLSISVGEAVSANCAYDTGQAWTLADTIANLALVVGIMKIIINGTY